MHFLLKHKMLQFVFKYLLIWLLHISVLSGHHQGAYDGTLLKLHILANISDDKGLVNYITPECQTEIIE